MSENYDKYTNIISSITLQPIKPGYQEIELVAVDKILPKAFPPYLRFTQLKGLDQPQEFQYGDLTGGWCYTCELGIKLKKTDDNRFWFFSEDYDFSECEDSYSEEDLEACVKLTDLGKSVLSLDDLYSLFPEGSYSDQYLIKCLGVQLLELESLLKPIVLGELHTGVRVLFVDTLAGALGVRQETIRAEITKIGIKVVELFDPQLNVYPVVAFESIYDLLSESDDVLQEVRQLAIEGKNPTQDTDILVKQLLEDRIQLPELTDQELARFSGEQAQELIDKLHHELKQTLSARLMDNAVHNGFRAKVGASRYNDPDVDFIYKKYLGDQNDVTRVLDTFRCVYEKQLNSIKVLSRRLFNAGVSGLAPRHYHIQGLEAVFLHDSPDLKLQQADIELLQKQKSALIEYYFRCCEVDKTGKFFIAVDKGDYNEAIEITQAFARNIAVDNAMFCPLLYAQDTYWGDSGIGSRQIPEDYNGRHTLTIELAFCDTEENWSDTVYYFIGEGTPVVN